MTKRPNCPYCGSNNLRVNKTKSTGIKYRCKDCARYFTARRDELDPYSCPIQISKPGIVESGNRAALMSDLSKDKIPTVEEILDQFGVDRRVWQIKDYRVNHYEGPASRNSDKEKAVYYQIRANLIRISAPKCTWPVVTPVKIAPKEQKRRISVSRGLKRAIVYFDAQTGYLRKGAEMVPTHDSLALGVLGEAIRTLSPDIVIGGGDNLDLPELGDKFVRTPEFVLTTQAAINERARWLAQFRGYAGEWHEIEGNHEARFSRYIYKNILAAADLRPAEMVDERPPMSVPYLLGLDSMGIVWHGPYPDGEVWINDNLMVCHGIKLGTKPGATVGKLLEAPRCSIIQGHAHRQESAHRTTHRRRGPVVYGAYSVGCMCRLDGVVPAHSARENWQQGFAIVDFDDTRFKVDMVNIYDGEAIIHGRVVAAKEGD